MKLTLPQVLLMNELKSRRLSYSPGEALAFDNGKKVSWKTVRSLKRKGLVTNYDLHPWGPDPVYGICLTDAGKDMVNEWDKVSEQIIDQILREEKETKWMDFGICFGA